MLSIDFNTLIKPTLPQTEEDIVHAKENKIEIVESPFFTQILNKSGQKVPTASSANVAGVATFLIGKEF